jgi:hypothetical protein
MKKILLLLCCAFAASTAFAQIPTIGIKGGVNFASLSSSSNAADGTYNTGALTSFSAGIFVDFKTGGSLSIQPALLYTGKGGKESADFDGSNVSAKAKINYLQVPVNFVFNAPIAVGTFFVGAGPYVGYGLSAKVEASFDGKTESQEVDFGDVKGQYKRIEAGATGIAGIKFKQGLMLNLNYDLGLTNISNETDSSTKTRVFGISVGYAF